MALSPASSKWRGGQREALADQSVVSCSAEMLRRPWPPLYRHYAGADYHVPPPARDKGRDYYLLAPLYRDAMPPPPPLPPPLNLHRRHLLQPQCACLHRVRSRSLDHVDTIVRCSDEDSDPYRARHQHPAGKENYNYNVKRRSMEDLLEHHRAPRRPHISRHSVRNTHLVCNLRLIEISAKKYDC